MTQKELSKQERRDWMRLIRTENVGPATFYQLIKRFGSAAEALKQAPDYAAKLGRKRAFVLPSLDVIDREIDFAEHIGANFIASCEDTYPKALKAISDPPPVLCFKGDRSLFAKNAIGIVGSRNASAMGRKFTATLARDLGEQNIVITSGLARGIDAAAHEASLTTGTIAVVAGGIDVIYPPENAALSKAISEQGLIISEMPLTFQPRARDFPRRNRLISGLCYGIVVVEAALKSGTLITSRYALEQGREVFAVPGSPLDPRCQGTNRLIRDGATLIEHAGDIMESLQSLTSRVMEHEQEQFNFDTMSSSYQLEENMDDALPHARDTIYDLLGYTPVHRDMLIRESNLPTALVATALLELVLAGNATESSGGMFVREA